MKKRRTTDNAPLCKCGHRCKQHAQRGSGRFPTYKQCTACPCQVYKSDGKPTGSTGPK